MEKIKFENIKDKIQNTNNLWLIAERKWTLKANLDILEAEAKNETPQKTGIFLTDKIEFDNFDVYDDCIQLIFFNHERQFQFIAVSNECSDYIYQESDVKGITLDIRNVYKEDKNYKDNYRFGFAETLKAVHELNKGNKIKAVVDSDNHEWRLWHE